MKIALVVPPSTRAFNETCPPMNLGYLASYVRQFHPEIELRIFDGMVAKDIEVWICGFQPDIVGVTATTAQAPSAYRLLENLKRKLPNALLVLGGAHATVMPNEAIEYADCVVVGEGETVFLRIVEDTIYGKKLRGLFKGEPLPDLNVAPSPAFDLMDNEYYLKHGVAFPNLVPPVLSLVTSRGCPYRCVFCGNSYRTSLVRYFNAERIADEIEYFRRRYGINSVFFNDDEFLIHKKRLRALVVEFKRRGFTEWLVWGCQARVQTISDIETLQLAKSVGCVYISTGFESPIPRILGYLKQYSTTTEQQETALKAAEKVGVTIGGSFILGTPSETLEEMKQTFKWFENHHSISYFGLNVLTPFPTTPIWRLCRKYGLLPEKVDYERLVPTNRPSETYIINDCVHPKMLDWFVRDVAKLSWMYSQTRINRSVSAFLRLARLPVFWYTLLLHPRKFSFMLKFVTVKNWRGKN